MNWHLSNDPEKPDSWEYCTVVIEQKNRHCLRTSRIYSKEKDEFFFFTDDENCEITKFKDTIAWIGEDEFLNDFKEFYKRNNKPASPPTQKQLDFIESICEELDIEFTGTTKEEARQFISSHIDEFELANEAYALEHEDAGDRPE